MSPTVPIREEDKEELKRLQTRIALETGEQPSLEEVIHRIVELAERHEDELVAEDEPPRLTEDEKQHVLDTTFDLGYATREEDIDETLYGDPERRP